MKPLLLMVPAAALGVMLVSGCQKGSSTSTGSGPAGAATTAAGSPSGSTGGPSGSTGGASGSTGGASGSTGGASGSTGGASGSTGGASGSTGGASGSTGGASGTGGTPSCRISQLAVSIGDQQGGDGHSSGAIRFRNTGTSACRLYGYPGVAALDSSGKQVAQAQRTLRGYMGGLASGQHTPTAVALAPGHTASALVEAANAAPNGNSCGTIPTLLVTPPDETHHIKLSWQGGCASFQIHPVVTGDTGRGAGHS
jgi:hypothetical protein